MSTAKRITQVIAGERVESIPGDTLHRLTKDHISVDGIVYPAGTEYRPESAGRNNMYDRDEQVIIIAGRSVTFSGADV